jgi:hypothetical protein
LIRPFAIQPARAFLVAGHALFLALCILSLVHWRERTMQLDSACQIFKWINNHGVQVEAHRYAAILPQLLVKALATTGASLSVLLKTASLAHVLVPWMIYAIIAHVLRRPWIAVAAALCAVLCTRLAFYGPVLEAHYLLSYPLLFAAFLDADQDGRGRTWTRAGTIISLAAVLLVHPVGALVALFVLAVFLARAQERKFLFVLAALTIVWVLAGRYVFPPTAYEQGFYSAVGLGLSSFALGASQPAFDFLIGHSWSYTTHYLALWAVLIVLAVVLVRSRAWKLLALVLVSVLGFILLHAAAYHAGETAMMMEKNFLPLAVLVILPLALELGAMNERVIRWSFIPFVLVLFLQFRGIAFASRESHARLVRIAELVEQARAQDISNGLIADSVCDAHGLHIHWAMAYETLLVSAVDAPERAVLIHPANWLDVDKGIAPERMGIVGHRIDPASLDARWFAPASTEMLQINVRSYLGAIGPWTASY